jgi:hypothetical protein
MERITREYGGTTLYNKVSVEPLASNSSFLKSSEDGHNNTLRNTGTYAQTKPSVVVAISKKPGIFRLAHNLQLRSPQSIGAT